MNFTYVGRNLDIPESLKNWAEKKLSKLEKFFHEDSEVKITIGKQRGKFIVECTIHSQSLILRIEEVDTDPIAAVDRLVPAFERQLRKHKTRLSKRLRSGSLDDITAPIVLQPEEEREFNIVKTKTVDMKPMSTEEAILQMNLVGHEFFIFTDAKSLKGSLVYKRKDGNYGLIELA